MEIQPAQCGNESLNPQTESESPRSTTSAISGNAVRSGTPTPVDLSESETVSPASTATTDVWDVLAEQSSTVSSSGLPSDTQIGFTEVKAASHLLAPCLQCEMKRLPCNKSRPSCSRCIRNGHGELCLAQRRMTGAELVYNGHLPPGWTVVTRQETDEDKTWESKLRLRQELLDEQQTRKDRSNWAYPPGRGTRSGFPKHRVRAIRFRAVNKLNIPSVKEGAVKAWAELDS